MERHVCPPWAGWLLISPFRQWRQDPEKILGPHITPGMMVLEPGCAMGFFSLPAARMVGPQGKVVCVDMQAVMLKQLKRRAGKAGLEERIETRLCGASSLGVADLAGSVDFALVLAVAHEVPDQDAFFREIAETLKPGGRMLFAEPAGHVNPVQFQASLEFAGNHGLAVMDRGKGFGSIWALHEKR